MRQNFARSLVYVGLFVSGTGSAVSIKLLLSSLIRRSSRLHFSAFGDKLKYAERAKIYLIVLANVQISLQSNSTSSIPLDLVPLHRFGSR